MRVINGIAQKPRDPKPLGGPQLMNGAVVIEPRSIHVFHNQVRETVVARAAIQQAADIRVDESREYLAPLAEAFERPQIEARTLHDLIRATTTWR